ncbi:MAG: hypothetical protein BM558_00090 [Roseobacter sp. MedPE-SW]|nr:MAG: hypothetical protein BM558_00090 [Roseobacter sp. MedPE-SW]
MSDTDKSLSEMDHLEDLFAAARSTPAQLPDSLQATLLADAEQVQATRARAKNTAVASETGRVLSSRKKLSRQLWRQFVSAVGGWPALGGLVAASLSGLWIGLAPPSFLPDPIESFASYSSGSQVLSDLDYDVSFLLSDEVFE